MSEQESFLVTGVYSKTVNNGWHPVNAIRFIRAVSADEAIGKFMVKASNDSALIGYNLIVRPVAYSSSEIVEFAK